MCTNVLRLLFLSLRMSTVSLFLRMYQLAHVLKYRITSKRSLFYNNRIVFLERNVKCYERRKKCYERFGWCYADDTWGFCNEINYLPDEPDDEDPLFEVPTIIWPKEVIFLDI